jgi:hypothetical protein
MDISSKKDLALAFLRDLAIMPRDRLQEIIRDTVGEELASVMFGYARQVMEADPDRGMENASSLMILGYLIRVHEQGELPSQQLPA